MKRALPLPARFILLVLLVVVVPLGMMGFWLAGSAARSGEELLRSRLRQTNERVATEIASDWLRRRSELLGFADAEAVQRALAAPSASSPPSEVEARFASLGPQLLELTVRDATGSIVWQFASESRAVPTFNATVQVRGRPGGQPLGTLEARLSGDAVLGGQDASSPAVGAVVGVIDPVGGASLRGLPFDPSILENPEFEWEGESWVAERRALMDPRLDVVSAAPLAEFAAPFEIAARDGLVILVAVALVATALAALLTRRMTRSLAQLAVAADSVSRGDLSPRLPDPRSDEVGRVTEAFSRMAERLKTTMAELAQREALAAVGSFASELAHEVRNPLTSIKVDLQFVEESLPTGNELRSVQRGAVEQIDRLDRTVTGVLQIARSGQIVTEPLDLRDPVLAAVRTVESIASAAGSRVEADTPDAPLIVLGDRNALQRLFTNLLANAVQAVAEGGSVDVRAFRNGRDVVVNVSDDGPGISGERLSRVREPFYSTRSEGTGLGLAIADRIASAHGATLTIESEPGRGTRVTVRLPLGVRSPDYTARA